MACQEANKGGRFQFVCLNGSSPEQLHRGPSLNGCVHKPRAQRIKFSTRSNLTLKICIVLKHCQDDNIAASCINFMRHENPIDLYTLCISWLLCVVF